MIRWKDQIDNYTMDTLSLKITTAMAVSIRGNWHGTNVISPFSRLYYVKSGGGKIYTDNQEIELKPYHIYIVPVGLKFSYDAPGEMEKIYFHFNIFKPNGYDFLNELKKINEIECDPEYIEEIYSLFKSERLIDSFNLKIKVLEDISKLITDEYSSNSDSVKYSKKVYAAMQIISSNLTIKLKIRDIAKKLFVSESDLSKKFKKEVGMSIGNYIDQMVMYAAQTALVETNDSLASISERFGFTDKYYFQRRFTQIFNETPTEYRRKLKLYDK